MPDGRIDTGMPIAVRRAVVARAGAAEAVGSGQRSARSDRRGAEVLDVISVSPVPDGPFGQDRRYGPAGGRVNGVVHELPRGAPPSIHEFCTCVDIPWTNPRGRRSAICTGSFGSAPSDPRRRADDVV